MRDPVIRACLPVGARAEDKTVSVLEDVDYVVAV